MDGGETPEGKNGEGIRFSGVVRHGRARGRRLGFPTANLELDAFLAPRLKQGVYVGRVQWSNGRECGAVLNIGVRPTFAEGEWSVELHLLDFDGDLYGQRLQVKLLRRLRDERTFGEVGELIKQIEADIKQARAILRR